MIYWSELFSTCHCLSSFFHASINFFQIWMNKQEYYSGFFKSTLSLLFIISMFSTDFQSREALISPSFVWPLPTTSLFRIQEPFIALYRDHITSPNNLPRSSWVIYLALKTFDLLTLILALFAWFFWDCNKMMSLVKRVAFTKWARRLFLAQSLFLDIWIMLYELQDAICGWLVK